MSLRNLPEARTFERPQSLDWDVPSDLLAKWAEQPLALAGGDANTIDMLDVIGEDWWTGGGVTAQRVAARLKEIGQGDVQVNINSPGGDMFEGIAIYNLLRAHPAKVTVNVVGIAASAASTIAMAGDHISMSLGSSLMIHNCWSVVIGNRHDLRSAADVFEGFDAGLADIYEARSGLSRADIITMMDGESYIGPSEAVQMGLADEVASAAPAGKSAAAKKDTALMAKRQTEAALARAGFSRRDRQSMISALGGQRDAAPSTARDAGATEAALKQLIETMKS
jgi:ATP-dependent Clp protease, protease subunit